MQGERGSRFQPASFPLEITFCRLRWGRAPIAEPRTDTRLHIVTVTPTPGVVFLAGPADWDSRFLYRTLRDVSQLPVRGFVRLDGTRWRSMRDLRPVPAEDVRRAARRADLLILKGGVAAMAQGSSARGIWNWPSGENGEPQIPGDWYLTAGDASPIASAFLGQPVDSFPPAIQLASTSPAPGSWVALSAQLGRRGPLRPAVYRAAGGTHSICYRRGRRNLALGFSGGLQRAELSVMGGRDRQLASRGRGCLPREAPAPSSRSFPTGGPVVFEWMGAGAPEPLGVTWTGSAGPSSDTLHFDGNGRATAWLPPGEYRYRLSGRGRRHGGGRAVLRGADPGKGQPYRPRAQGRAACRPVIRARVAVVVRGLRARLVG